MLVARNLQICIIRKDIHLHPPPPFFLSNFLSYPIHPPYPIQILYYKTLICLATIMSVNIHKPS